VGDQLYGGCGFNRPALHAWELKIGETKLRCPLPDDFVSVMKAFGFERGLENYDDV